LCGYYFHNIKATISAFWLVENMSINPKSVKSAISLGQKMKLSAKWWNWVQIDWQLQKNWAGTNKMADKNKMNTETLSSTEITTGNLVIAKCVRKIHKSSKEKNINLSLWIKTAYLFTVKRNCLVTLLGESEWIFMLEFACQVAWHFIFHIKYWNEKNCHLYIINK